MKFDSIINIYIIKEMIPPFVLNLVFFTFIFLVSKLLVITELIVNYKAGIGTVFLMILYLLPYFLIFVIPMSSMMAVLLSFLRLSADNEIIALKTGGVSVWPLTIPVLVFCVSTAVLTVFMSIYGQPWSRNGVKELTLNNARADIGIKEGVFNDLKNIMFYVTSIDRKTGMLSQVFIEDKRDKETSIIITAPEGRLISDSKNSIFQVVLHDGMINRTIAKEKSVNFTYFDTYKMSLDIKKDRTQPYYDNKSEKDMTIAELLSGVKKRDNKYYRYLIELHKKFSLPFACISLGILAVPLGIRAKTNRKSAGIGMGLGFFLLYYLMLSAGLVFGETGKYPPSIGMWVPNIVTGLAGLILLRKWGR